MDARKEIVLLDQKMTMMEDVVLAMQKDIVVMGERRSPKVVCRHCGHDANEV
jgi:hypothetical protein